MPEIGATLREARLRAKLDITDVEQATKIRAKYLRALEDEQWSLLPGSTFIKSFLRTYADHLGLDARLLIEEYKLRYERPSEAELAPLRPGRQRVRDRPRPPWVSRAGVGLVLLALLAALVVLGTLGNGADRPAGGGAGVTGTQGRGDHGRRHRRRHAPRFVRLALIATGPVYVCLSDASGRTLVNGRTLAPGERLGAYRSRAFRMTLGNSLIRMVVNGRTRAVPPQSSPIGYLVSASGRRTTLPAARQPRCA